VLFKAFLSDFQTCLRHFLESCPTQIFGAAHVWVCSSKRDYAYLWSKKLAWWSRLIFANEIHKGSIVRLNPRYKIRDNNHKTHRVCWSLSNRFWKRWKSIKDKIIQTNRVKYKKLTEPSNGTIQPMIKHWNVLVEYYEEAAELVTAFQMICHSLQWILSLWKILINIRSNFKYWFHIPTWTHILNFCVISSSFWAI